MKVSVFILALILALSHYATAQETDPIVGGYTPLVWNGEDEELTDLLDWGVQEAVWEAIEAGELEDGEWSWTEVNSVSSQVVAGTNYDFDVDITNADGQTVGLDVVIFDQPWTETKDVVSWDISDEDDN